MGIYTERGKYMKRRILGGLSLLLCLLMIAPLFTVATSAATVSYKKGANNVSDAYKNSKFYKNLTQIELTGDGVTDLLAVALSQISYLEGTNQSGFNGTQGGNGNYTEYCYNMGSVGGFNYAWCAAYVSWSLLQSGCTDQNTQSAWCRNHEGDKNYIWREVGCYRWYNQLKRFGYGHADDGKYIPKSGDLIFFETSEHIGIVRYAKNGTVYTIEGNTKGGEGVASEGGGVYCKNYKIGGGAIRGYGSLPLKTNSAANKVDYSGANPSTGLWISSTNKYLYPDTTLNDKSNYTTIPKGTAFEVTKIISKDCFQAKYNGKTGYVSVNSASPIYQMTANAPATAVPETNPDKATDKATDKVTETVTANKYTITKDIKSVKEHIGSGLDKISIDGVKTAETETYLLNAGQKIGVSGFAGFSSAIKEFGYYFDGNAQGAVWGSSPKTADSNAKKKAGDKAKLFDIGADTSALTGGAHTVTYVVKFTNNKTCELITLNLDIVGGGEASSESGSGSETSAANGGGGCNGAISLAVAFPVALIGVALLKKKKED